MGYSESPLLGHHGHPPHMLDISRLSSQVLCQERWEATNERNICKLKRWLIIAMMIAKFYKRRVETMSSSTKDGQCQTRTVERQLRAPLNRRLDRLGWAISHVVITVISTSSIRAISPGYRLAISSLHRELRPTVIRRRAVNRLTYGGSGVY